MADRDFSGATAIIVIDLQKGMFEPQPVHDAASLTDRVHELLAWARRDGHPICFIRHDSDEQGDPLQPGGPGWEVWGGLGQQTSEPTFSKNVGDAFSQPLLIEWLGSIGHVILLGAQSECCVAATAAGALARGLSVTVVGDAHSTWSAAGRRAEDIIAEQNQRFMSQGARVEATRVLTGANRPVCR